MTKHKLQYGGLLLLSVTIVPVASMIVWYIKRHLVVLEGEMADEYDI